MALVQVKQNIINNQNCSSLLWADLTGWYNSTTNPYGYEEGGVHSTDPDDILTTAAYVDITPLSTGTKYTVQIPSANFNKTEIGKSGFSTVEIPSSTFSADTIPDGVYKVTYRFQLISSRKKVQVTQYIVSTCSIDCCINKKLEQMGCCNDCSDDKNNRDIYNLYRVHMLRDKIKYQLVCNNAAGAQETLECIQQYCNSISCSSCNH